MQLDGDRRHGTKNNNRKTATVNPIKVYNRPV